MSETRRPFIGKIAPYDWADKKTGETTHGLIISGRFGNAAHLTKTEAYALADRIVDAADKLPDTNNQDNE